MSRLPDIVSEQHSPDQKQIFDAITSGPRSRDGAGTRMVNAAGGLAGPFNAMLYSAEIGDRVQQLGAALRFSNSLPANALEIAVLVTARAWMAHFEWWAHARLAAKAGVTKAVIQAIAAGRAPPITDPSERAAYQFAQVLLTTRGVDDTTYAAAERAFGRRGVVDLVFLLGYYGLISMALNAFEVPLPDGEEAELKALDDK